VRYELIEAGDIREGMVVSRSRATPFYEVASVVSTDETVSVCLYGYGRCDMQPDTWWWQIQDQRREMEIWIEKSQAVVRRADGATEEYDEVLMCSNEAGVTSRVLSTPITLRRGDALTMTFEVP
jgi:hypothetical protein